jgi:hypothetical protein
MPNGRFSSCVSALFAATMLGAVTMALPFAVHAEHFSFMALGDTPYTLPRDYAGFQRLIDRTNRIRPAFTVHVGDIKSGATHCTDEVFAKAIEMFNSFDQPLIYTPGDNEWTDCHRANNGGYDPLERLAKLRQTMYAQADGFGRTRMALAHQSSDPQFSKFVENARWEKTGVVFASVHVIGSNNNLQRDQAAVNEYIERNSANLAWINAAFARASEVAAKGVVFFFQADLLFEKESEQDARSGFNDTINAFKRLAIAFGKPVLLIHGDHHHLVIDQPLMGPGRQRIMNVTRIMVHGDTEVHGTLVMVDTDDPDLFSYKPVYIPENIPPFKPPAKP